MKITINSPQEMARLAAKVAKLSGPGTVIALSGDLGAGKTTFTQSFVRARGIKDDVTSPTFVLMNVYGAKEKVYHFDFYRLGSIDDLEVIGAEEFIPAADGITLIEWADKVPEILPANKISLRIKVLGDTEREVLLEGLEKLKW
jgi:tRNA threonylcarbamoyladenosine biosynthesis protein TsaE